VSVAVPITAPGSYSGGSSLAPYDDYGVFGAFDWGWRYEAGDWRTFIIVVPAQTHELNVTISWADNATNIQAHLTGPLGYLVASSDYPVSPYIGSGKFAWSTSTGGPTQIIYAMNTQPGVYILVLHNTLFGASSFNEYPENFTLNVQYS
jgi:hypothetical protein